MFPRRRAKRSAADAALPVEVVDEPELAALCALSDFDGAVQALLAEFPASRLGLPPLALHSQLYALLPDRTAVDRALDAAARRDARLTTLHIVALGEDAFIETAALAAELSRTAAAAAPRSGAALALAARALVGRCRGAVLGADLAAAFGAARADEGAAELARAGVLVRRAGVPVDAAEWAWALPALGGLASELGAATRACTAELSRRPFHELPAAELRARLAAAGPGPARRRKPSAGGGVLGAHGACGPTARAPLDWAFVERYLCGRGVLLKKAVGRGGALLALADADAARRQAAPPRPRGG